MVLLRNYESDTDTNRKPLVIAHRGASGVAPENTLAAFRLAARCGANGVEMDVQLSADGRVVVIHDARVNRTTTGTGPVASFTLSQLRELDASEWFERRLALRPRVRSMAERAAAHTSNHGSLFQGETIPTLEEALSLLASYRLSRIYVELKSKPSTRQALLEATIAVVRDLSLENAITLLSFDHQIIKDAKQIASEIRTAATFPIAGRTIATARSIISSVERVNADEAALHFGLATKRTVATLHERGLSVSAWTANNKMVMRRLVACGVDSIMTNFPDRLRSVIESPPALRLALRRNGSMRKRRR